jgi:ligand-binding sensor domain-containing protein/serine phosphatase RsbU (regulator of sigma subunit)
MIKGKGILLLFFLTLTSNIFPQSYNFRNFGSEAGFPESFVYSITQDRNGYLWIGTGKGLSKYNGFTFENYSTEDSLANNFITCAIRDYENLWFGHIDGKITYFDGSKFHPVHLPEQNKSPVTHFAESPDRKIWGSTLSDGLLELGLGTGVKKHKFSKENISVTTFDFLSESELIVGTNTGLLFCRINEPDEIDIIQTIPQIPESKIVCINKMRNGAGFFIATENDGIFQLSDDEKLFRVSEVKAEQDFVISGIQNIYEDSQSNLWLASYGNGLIRLSPDVDGIREIFIFNKAGGFITNNVKIVFEDREGVIWSGNYGDGLTQVIPKSFSIMEFNHDLYGNSIFSIYLNESDKWIGTDKGLLKTDMNTGKVIRFFSKENGLPKDTVTAIHSSNGKDLWIGTEKSGLFRMNTADEKIIRFPLGNGALENSVTIITGKGNYVWAGTKKGLCNIDQPTGKIKWYSINQGGLPHNSIRNLYLDAEERLWVSTKSSILAFIADEKVTKIPLNLGSGILTLGPVTEDTDSRVWVGSDGNGLFLVESDTATNLTKNEGLLSDYCYSLISDKNQFIWVIHKNGLTRIRTTDFSVKPVSHIEEISGDFQFNPNAASIDQNGKIWFGTNRGLVSYDPANEFPFLEPPVVGITSFRINDTETEFRDNKIILPPGNYKIRVEFLGISLKDPELVTYQYMLEGYDNWSDITVNRGVTYDHLAEGVYTFMLRASSGDGAVTENPLMLSIIIKKPVWKKWWFFPVCAILIIIFTFIHTKRRELRFQAEKEILEKKVRERTYEIECQKNEIESQRDMINEKNASIMSSITYARNIQNYLLPPTELLDKLFPDNFILNKPKDIVSGDFYWLTEKNGKIVFTVADCTGHGVPGAFMSILGITLLNEIVNIHGITRSDDIVANLRERVIQSLQQERKDISSKDGMDISLCVLDPRLKRIQFTGGINDLIFIRDEKLNVLKADRFPVGAYDDYQGFFSIHEVEYKKGDVFYLCSDGYRDQFGGDFDKKFLRQNFYLTLLEIHRLPLAEQKMALEKKLIEWMKDNPQTDDITVMGVRL